MGKNKAKKKKEEKREKRRGCSVRSRECMNGTGAGGGDLESIQDYRELWARW